MYSLKRFTTGAFAVPFEVLNQKAYDMISFVVSELVPLRGAKNSKPRPRNRTFVPLRGSFQNFRRVFPPPRLSICLFLLSIVWIIHRNQFPTLSFEIQTKEISRPATGITFTNKQPRPPLMELLILLYFDRWMKKCIQNTTESRQSM